MDHEDNCADISSPDVTTKYQAAAGIVNEALALVISLVKEGADIYEVCAKGDDYILEKTGKLYNKKVKDEDGELVKVEKGIAFPTCVSVNEIVGHFSPLKGESRVLQKGDCVKIDLGAHIDGFIATAAHTVVIGGGKGRVADCVKAAWTAAEAALRQVQVGNTNTSVTEVITKSAEQFKCTPVQGVLSHQMKQHVIDGSQAILSSPAPSPEQDVPKFEFQLNEVYNVDIVMTTGDGRSKRTELRSTVFKRNIDEQYILKLQKARQFISEVNKRFPCLPFSLRNFEDEQMAKVGVSEARRHELVEEYPVLTEREGEFVAQFKFTVLLLPGGTKKVCGVAFEQDGELETEYSVTDEALKALLAKSANPKKKKKTTAAAAK